MDGEAEVLGHAADLAPRPASGRATSTSGARAWAAAPKSGRVKQKVEPSPGALRTSKRPPWARTMRSQM